MKRKSVSNYMRSTTRSLFTLVLAVTAGVLSMGVVFTSQAAITWTDFSNIDSDGNASTATYEPGEALPTANIQSANLSVVNYAGSVSPTTGTSTRLALSGGGYGATLTFTLLAESGGAQLSGLGLSLANYVSGHPTYISWAYKIGDSSTVSLDPSTTSWNANGTYQYSLNTPVTFDGGQILKLIGTLDNSGTATSPIWFNDFSLGVTAVPEPANVALGMFGILSVCVGVCKRYWKK